MTKQSVNDSLDVLAEDLGIVDLRTGVPPTSEKEQDLIRIQLLAAQIVANDVLKIKKISPRLSSEQITGRLVNNWAQNIKDFASAILEREKAVSTTTCG